MDGMERNENGFSLKGGDGEVSLTVDLSSLPHVQSVCTKLLLLGSGNPVTAVFSVFTVAVAVMAHTAVGRDHEEVYANVLEMIEDGSVQEIMREIMRNANFALLGDGVGGTNDDNGEKDER